MGLEMEWKPLETAPHDRYVLVWREGWESPVWAAYGENYLTGEKRICWFALDDWEDWCRNGDGRFPTHWIELPPYPTKQPPR